MCRCCQFPLELLWQDRHKVSPQQPLVWLRQLPERKKKSGYSAGLHEGVDNSTFAGEVGDIFKNIIPPTPPAKVELSTPSCKRVTEIYPESILVPKKIPAQDHCRKKFTQVN